MHAERSAIADDGAITMTEGAWDRDRGARSEMACMPSALQWPMAITVTEGARDRDRGARSEIACCPAAHVALTRCLAHRQRLRVRHVVGSGAR